MTTTTTRIATSTTCDKMSTVTMFRALTNIATTMIIVSTPLARSTIGTIRTTVTTIISITLITVSTLAIIARNTIRPRITVMPSMTFNTNRITVITMTTLITTVTKYYDHHLPFSMASQLRTRVRGASPADRSSVAASGREMMCKWSAPLLQPHPRRSQVLEAATVRILLLVGPGDGGRRDLHLPGLRAPDHGS